MLADSFSTRIGLLDPVIVPFNSPRSPSSAGTCSSASNIGSVFPTFVPVSWLPPALKPDPPVTYAVAVFLTHWDVFLADSIFDECKDAFEGSSAFS